MMLRRLQVFLEHRIYSLLDYKLISPRTASRWLRRIGIE